MTDNDPTRTAMRMLLRSIDAADWQVVEALLHLQVEYEVSGNVPMRGRDAVMNYYRNVRPVRSGEHLLESMAVEGSTGICWGRFNATLKDGQETTLLFADVMTFEDRKVRKRRVYFCEPRPPGA